MTRIKDSIFRALSWVFRLLRIYLVPVILAASASVIYLILVVAVANATLSSLLIIAMVVLPGLVLIVISRTEREHWGEYAVVWLLYVTSVPVYGIGLFIGGYTFVLARAFRRHWPHPIQELDEDDEV